MGRSQQDFHLKMKDFELWAPPPYSQEAEYIKQASEAWEEAIRIAESKEGRKEEKNDKKTGDIVESRKNEKGKKIYRWWYSGGQHL